MGSHGSGACRTRIVAILALTFALFTHNATAAIPPAVNAGAGINLTIPAVGESVVVNLRQLGAISGSPPLLINPQQLDFQLDGEPFGLLEALPFLAPNARGSVCVLINNLDYTFDPQDTLELVISVSSLSTPQPTPPLAVTVTGTAGPVVNVDDPVQVAACGDPNTPPVANAGADQTVTAVNGVSGPVVLDGSASSDADPGTVLTYQWSEGDTLFPPTTENTLTIPSMTPGTYTFALVVVDDSGDAVTSTSQADTVTITVVEAVAPTANAGADQNIADSDGEPGEDVTLDGTGSSSTSPIATYEWVNAQEEQIATGATPTVRLADGEHVITLIVTNEEGLSDTDEVTIAISAPMPGQAPLANAGADQELADSDGEAGELVTLDGSGSSDPDGDELTFLWTLAGEPEEALGTDPILTVRLPDGVNTVTLRVEDPDGNFAVDTVVVTIAAPSERVPLSQLPNLTPNKMQVALALDRICTDLDALVTAGSPLTSDQQALLERCNGLYFENTAANQSAALEALGADDFAAARTQTLLFSNSLYASVMDRLVALRGGARGLSLAGLNIVVDGQLVPLAQLQDMAKDLLGGGASSEPDEPGGLLSDKWGIWARGNYSFGSKDRSSTSPSFEADQWALMGGIDYRISDLAVIGASLAYGQSAIDFDPADEGSLDTTSWAASLYGSMYAAKNFYFDALLNAASSDYDARRNITYVDGTGLINADASGATDGITLSGGISAGYDFLLGRFTISPNLGAFYIDASIDGFTESGAAGLNLIYDEQNFSSLTGNIGLRMTYAWSTSWGVLLPHLRVDFVREFEDDVDVFGVRFAADPNAPSTPPILVETDNPDRSYWRMATGFSAQFTHGISGYIEYQRLESFEFISFEDISIGLRMQKSF